MNYLFAAYSAIWIIVFIYLFSLWSRQSNINRTLESLSRKIDTK